LTLFNGEVFASQEVRMFPNSVFDVDTSIVRVGGGLENNGGTVSVKRGSLYLGAEAEINDGNLDLSDGGFLRAQHVSGFLGGSISVRRSSMEVQQDLGFGLHADGTLTIADGGRIDVHRDARLWVPLMIEVGESGISPAQPALFVEGGIDLFDVSTGQQSSLTVLLDPAYTPRVDDVFNLFDFGDVNGTFSQVIPSPRLPSHLFLDPSMLYVNGTIRIGTAPPGDFNQDGTVDAADYVVWRAGLGVRYSQADYDVWRANFGLTASGGATASPGSATVPETSTAYLLLMAAAGLFFGRPRSRLGSL
jgi:hypothetical protein